MLFNRKQKRVYIAGTVCGSSDNVAEVEQLYREVIRGALDDRYDNLVIYDPILRHPNSFDYDDVQMRETFAEYERELKRTDLLIAYLPTASMGTAIEMYFARKRSNIITISPLALNWVIRMYSDKNYLTLEDFIYSVMNGELDQFLLK